MLQPTRRAAQLQRWHDRLATVADGARDTLRQVDPARLARRSGCTLAPDGTLHLRYYGHGYEVSTPGFEILPANVRGADVRGEAAVRSVDLGGAYALERAILLTYLLTSDGTPPSGHWIAYHDLPGGMFYAQAFRGYAEVRLVRELGAGGLAAFQRAAERQAEEGIPTSEIDVGSAGYAFQVLPRVRLGAVYWEGDEDFSAQASILFEDSATHYMSTDGLAVLGSHLVNVLLAAAHAPGSHHGATEDTERKP
jgi:hypothetical protein